jgi:hypothetical protein
MTKADSTGDDGVWRDPERLTASELSEAVGVYSTDGQADDATGGDAGAEQVFGESAAEAANTPTDEPPDPEYAANPPDPERHRPSPEGRTGPT